MLIHTDNFGTVLIIKQQYLYSHHKGHRFERGQCLYALDRDHCNYPKFNQLQLAAIVRMRLSTQIRLLRYG